MKEYKLIKEYPGSPKLGTIASDLGFRYNFLGENRSCFDYTKTNEEVRDIENFPEFWSLIKKSLFITHDGISIGPDDCYYFLDDVNSIIPGKPSPNCTYADNVLRFSTKEAANRYLINTIKILSIADVYQILNEYRFDRVVDINLHRFVKKAEENLLNKKK